MISSLWTAATGMNSQQTNIDVISNNLANVNTSGFKKAKINFADLILAVKLDEDVLYSLQLDDD